MYETYYGLKEKPFSIQPDPDFLFMSKRHRLAYTMLEYAIRTGRGGVFLKLSDEQYAKISGTSRSMGSHPEAGIRTLE